MSDKKKMQLGMNPSTASHRLVKDLLWNFVKTTGQESCCKCGEIMRRESFSIEHVIPWLDSEDPVGMYFDLENIKYSHLSCNRADARNTTKKYFSREEKLQGQRDAQKVLDKSRVYCPKARREQYQKHGR